MVRVKNAETTTRHGGMIADSQKYCICQKSALKKNQLDQRSVRQLWATTKSSVSQSLSDRAARGKELILERISRRTNATNIRLFRTHARVENIIMKAYVAVIGEHSVRKIEACKREKRKRKEGFETLSYSELTCRTSTCYQTHRLERHYVTHTHIGIVDLGAFILCPSPTYTNRKEKDLEALYVTDAIYTESRILEFVREHNT